jgi:hypothetical protein
VSDYGREHQVLDCRDADLAAPTLALIQELRDFCSGAPPAVSAHEGPEATRLVMVALQSMDGGGVTVEMDEIPNADV